MKTSIGQATFREKKDVFKMRQWVTKRDKDSREEALPSNEIEIA